MVGVADSLAEMKSAGYAPARWGEAMLKSGNQPFYEYKNGNKIGVYDVRMEKYVRIAKAESPVILKGLKVILENAGATLYHLADGIACLEFLTKMTPLDEQ